MVIPILSVRIQSEKDIVAARQRARQIAAHIGFEVQDQTRIATALSEIARNAHSYAGGGTVSFLVEGRTPPQLFCISIQDKGPGVRNLDKVLSGEYKSRTGMGMGILGARRLVDQFHIESGPDKGTTVWLRKLLPDNAPLFTPARLAGIGNELFAEIEENALDELQQQNRELIRTLEELQKYQEELSSLNRELEDTNRGVVALLAELDEKADHLRRADQLKSHFLSNMSHEFRTPVNSILALSQILLGRSDGELTAEQGKQIEFIRKAAESLSDLVNDLLDLAKVEAGKIVVHPSEFDIENMFGALRGMLRPLLVNDSLKLIFEPTEALPAMNTDEGKVSQILRNFISNALKFTEQGEVRVSAKQAADGAAVLFSVSDTGIGIRKEDQERIFEEFTQLENPLQKRVKGTGLGLPLTKKLAELLGGYVSVESEPGKGSTFSAIIPAEYKPLAQPAEAAEVKWDLDPARIPVLVLEDQPEMQLAYKSLLKDSEFQPVAARNVREARAALRNIPVKAVILDILLEGEHAWNFLAEVKAHDATRDISVLVVTQVEDERKGIALGADAYRVKPVSQEWLLETLRHLTREGKSRRVLLIDDDDTSRYLLRKFLEPYRFDVYEAAGGEEGLRLAQQDQPFIVFLDLLMPGLDGFEVLDRLKADARLRETPVIIVTSKTLDDSERRKLTEKGALILAKRGLSSETVRDAIVQCLPEA